MARSLGKMLSEKNFGKIRESWNYRKHGCHQAQFTSDRHGGRGAPTVFLTEMSTYVLDWVKRSFFPHLPP